MQFTTDTDGEKNIASLVLKREIMCTNNTLAEYPYPLFHLHMYIGEGYVSHLDRAWTYNTVL